MAMEKDPYHLFTIHINTIPRHLLNTKPSDFGVNAKVIYQETHTHLKVLMQTMMKWSLDLTKMTMTLKYGHLRMTMTFLMT